MRQTYIHDEETNSRCITVLTIDTGNVWLKNTTTAIIREWMRVMSVDRLKTRVHEYIDGRKWWWSLDDAFEEKQVDEPNRTERRLESGNEIFVQSPTSLDFDECREYLLFLNVVSPMSSVAENKRQEEGNSALEKSVWKHGRGNNNSWFLQRPWESIKSRDSLKTNLVFLVAWLEEDWTSHLLREFLLLTNMSLALLSFLTDTTVVERLPHLLLPQKEVTWRCWWCTSRILREKNEGEWESCFALRLLHFSFDFQSKLFEPQLLLTQPFKFVEEE
jgi:hypothetical protein